MENRGYKKLLDVNAQLTECFNVQDIEDSILGSLMVDENLYLDVKKRIAPFMFSSQLILSEVIFDFLSIGQPIVTSKILSACYNKGLKGLKSSDIEYLKACCDLESFSEYCHVLQENWHTKEKSFIACSFLESILAGAEISKVSDAMESSLELVRQRIEMIDEKENSFNDDLDRTFEKIEKSVKDGGTLSGLDTSIDTLTRMTGGFQFGGLSIIGGESGRGKSTVGIQFLRTIAMNNTPVLFVSIEMTPDQYNRKMLCNMTSISTIKIQRGELINEELESLRTAKEHIQRYPFHSETKKMKFFDIVSAIKKHVRLNGVKFVLIDHLAAIEADSKKQTNEIYNDFSNQLKSLAKLLDIHIMLLAQRNRKENNQRPKSQDLRYGGEQGADLIIFPFSSEDAAQSGRYRPTELIVTKNRDTGETGVIDVFFDTFSETYYEDYPERTIINFVPKDNTITRKSALSDDDFNF